MKCSGAAWSRKRVDMGGFGDLFRRFLAGFVDVMASSSVVLGRDHARAMYQNRSDALEILTDHAEIQASIFRGAIAEKKELRDFRRVL